MPDLVQITTPKGVRFTVAKEAAPAFQAFVSELEGRGYTFDQAHSGGYANRNIRGTDTPSQHSFGRAIDVNWHWNPRSSNTDDLPNDINDLAAKHGLTWGGTWRGATRDPMHFEWTGGAQPTAARTTPVATSSDDVLSNLRSPTAKLDAKSDTKPAAASSKTDDILTNLNGAPAAPAAAPATTPKQPSTTQEPPPEETQIASMYGGAIPPEQAEAIAPTKSEAKSAVPFLVEKAANALNDFPSGQEIRAALAPKPGTEYGTVLPIARDVDAQGNFTGPPRLALPSSLRDLAIGGVDLLRSPETGVVTPEATGALAALVGGKLTPSVAGSPGAGMRAVTSWPGDARRAVMGPTAAEAVVGVHPLDAGVVQAAETREAIRTARGGEAAPSSPVPGATPPTAAGPSPGMGAPTGAGGDTTGLAGGLGNMGGAITGKLHDMLWAKIQAGDITELGTPSQLLVDAARERAAGGLKTRADYDQWVQQRGRLGAGAQAGPAPAAAGAQATPAGAAAMTPEEAAAHRYVADKQWLMKSKPPGEADPTEYIPGIQPTAAQREQTAVRAREMKTVRNLSPEVKQEEDALLSHHNDLRKEHYAEIAGSEVTRTNDLKAATDKIEADLKTVWKNKKPADAQPVVDAANAELDGSAGMLPPVRDVVQQVRNAVTKADGSLETDPQKLYAARRLINFMQSKAGRAANPAYGHGDVEATLVRLKQAVDNVIDPAAPGFRQAISDYAAARGPVDAAEALQAREGGLLDSQGRMQFTKVHSLLRDVIEAQKPGAPISPLRNVSEEQLTRLKSLHDDLQRVASAADLERARGSDTVQNIADAAKALGKLGARGAAHGAASWALGPGVGSIAVESAGRLFQPLTAARSARKLQRRGEELLRPKNPLDTGPP